MNILDKYVYVTNKNCNRKEDKKREIKKLKKIN